MTIIGSALGAWWVVTQQRSRAARSPQPRQDRGTVIFANTPRASDSDAVV